MGTLRKVNGFIHCWIRVFGYCSNEKINGLTAGIAYQQFTNRGILIALVVAILGGAAKLFGFFPPINLLIKFLVKKR
jgi:hypothetical protein